MAGGRAGEEGKLIWGKRAHLLASAGAFKLSLGLGELYSLDTTSRVSCFKRKAAGFFAGGGV